MLAAWASWKNHYKHPLLLESLIYAISFLRKTYTSICFCSLKEIPRGFVLFRKKAKSENNDQRWFCIELLEAARNPAARVGHQATSPGTTSSVSASSRRCFELCRPASLVDLDLFLESVISKMGPRVIGFFALPYFA